MKKFFLLTFSLFYSLMLISQTQRLVLLEQFTQASCGPCATVNPGIESLLNSNPDKITSVWYHTSWPGVDPMYNQNPADVNARVGLYMSPSNQYVPYSVLDGNYYNGSATGWNINTVNARYAVPSPFALQLRQVLNATQDTVFLTLIAKCTQAVTGAMVAHNVVIEKNIHFNTPPGNNGEKDFKNVMKKMLPTYSGTAIPSSMSNGDYTIIETFWKLANVYDLNQLAAVSWIQNTSTKEIHQTTNNTTVPLVFPYNTDLQAMEISNIIPNNCSGKITPVLKIRNNGNNTITSFQVKYQVNNGTVSSYTWNGSLTSLQKTLVTLPEYSFTPTTTNILKIYSTSPNSTSDEYPKNDTATFSIAGAKVTTNMLFLQLKTDNRPQETSWDVKNSAGQVVVSHGAYTLPNHISIDTINLPSYDCYKFTMYDAGNNGLCCSFGVGGFELDDAPGGVILQGNTFGSIIANELSYDNATGIRIIESLNGLSVYPNPFSGQTTVSFNLPHESPVTIQVTNLLGQVEKNFYFGILSTGSHAVGIDCGNLAKGIYLLDLRAGAERKMQKILIE